MVFWLWFNWYIDIDEGYVYKKDVNIIGLGDIKGCDKEICYSYYVVVNEEKISLNMRCWDSMREILS